MKRNSDPRTVLVVPCFNEAARLPVDAFRSFTVENPQVRVLFVDDGSNDGTADLLEVLRGEAPAAFDILTLSKNEGKAEAVRRGVLAALDQECDFVGYWDADLATPLQCFPDFLDLLIREPDVELVLGSRVRLLGRRIDRRPSRHYLGRIFATAASLVLGLPVYDTQCGAKLFRATPVLRDAFSAPFLSRWIFDVEVLARLLAAARSGKLDPEKAMRELPLFEWSDVEGSGVRPIDFARSAFELVLIRRRYPSRITGP